MRLERLGYVRKCRPANRVGGVMEEEMTMSEFNNKVRDWYVKEYGIKKWSNRAASPREWKRIYGCLKARENYFATHYKEKICGQLYRTTGWDWDGRIWPL